MVKGGNWEQSREICGCRTHRDIAGFAHFLKYDVRGWSRSVAVGRAARKNIVNQTGSQERKSERGKEGSETDGKGTAAAAAAARRAPRGG